MSTLLALYNMGWVIFIWLIAQVWEYDLQLEFYRLRLWCYTINGTLFDSNLPPDLLLPAEINIL